MVNAYRRHREQQDTEYSNKKRSSGRVGLVWGGLVAGGVAQLNTQGRLNHEKMAKLIQVSNRRNRPSAVFPHLSIACGASLSNLAANLLPLRGKRTPPITISHPRPQQNHQHSRGTSQIVKGAARDSRRGWR